MSKNIFLVTLFILCFAQFSIAEDDIEIKKTYYSNGTLKQEIPYKNGKRDGVVKVYYNNGGLWLEASLEEGEKDGILREYDKNGNLIKQEFYKKGVLQINLADVPKPTKLEFDVYKNLMTVFWTYPTFFDNEAWSKIVKETAQQFSLTEEKIKAIYEKFETLQKIIPDIKIEEINWKEFEKRLTKAKNKLNNE